MARYRKTQEFKSSITSFQSTVSSSSKFQRIGRQAEAQARSGGSGVLHVILIQAIVLHMHSSTTFSANKLSNAVICS